MNFKEKLLKFNEKLLDLIYPDKIKCILCGKDKPNDDFICEKCLNDKIINCSNRCVKCDTSIKEGNIICDNCKSIKKEFEKCVCPLIYKDNVKNAVLKFKDDNAKYLAKPFAKLIFDRLIDENIDFDIIVPVPSHKKTVSKRGYNPALLLANEISVLSNKPVEEVLIKNVLSQNQKELTFSQRQTNLENCMKLTGKEIIKNKNILIVDDIITTCATINACASLLVKTNKIYGCAVARTQLYEID